MPNVVHLWNPRGTRCLPRHWLPFGQHITFPGIGAAPTAVLSIVPEGDHQLHARLECGDTVSVKALTPGEEIRLQLPSTVLIIDIKAIDSRRMLVQMDAESGARIKVAQGPDDARVLLSA